VLNKSIQSLILLIILHFDWHFALKYIKYFYFYPYLVLVLMNMIKLIVLKNRLSGILSVGHPSFSVVSGILSVGNPNISVVKGLLSVGHPSFSVVSGILSVVDIPSVPIPVRKANYSDASNYKIFKILAFIKIEPNCTMKKLKLSFRSL